VAKSPGVVQGGEFHSTELESLEEKDQECRNQICANDGGHPTRLFQVEHLVLHHVLEGAEGL
jgi:hypothetical protein